MMPKLSTRRSITAVLSTWCDVDAQVGDGLQHWIELASFNAGDFIAVGQLFTESLAALWSQIAFAGLRIWTDAPYPKPFQR